MPELPEVETVVNILKKSVIGKKIKSVSIFYNKLLKTNISIEEFRNRLKNRVIENISRIGKYIIFDLGNDVLISHLRMEGKWFFINDLSLINEKHIEAIFYFEDNYMLVYHDTRKFGTFNLETKESYLVVDPLKKLGPEPFNEVVDGNYIYNSMHKSNKFIKTVLLDQTKISGIGNIYADEILFDAGINPERKASSLSLKDYNLIYNSSKKILKRAIELGGSTISTYKAGHGISGKFQNELKVHLRKDQCCYNCNSKIIKKKVNGRGTYICLNCQKIY
ncbi:DNA-formamidopyrimidine glycosylase [Spiroplasma turonicum]|uniref:Formamidopyrimidine-DNA glycosylase n=1 Tax=Spiroplasma turonicum TaxID=216946 RepID=A0A0K1P518_9MOLU|nr:DNA-formamidopyrimidine glycosylase [Spiroplasma turonicum]AKU79411.1 formamidopyrimidine-DNA glycosylase [Spiroplasma turonicum]ALX70432.1 formamidopyrimidine-DNA glycosylase [Spiroplasma turonicum]